MEHARKVTPHLLQYRKRVPVRVAVVDADGQSRRACNAELHDKELALHGTRLRIFLPVVVQSDLPNRDHLRMLRPREQLRTLRIRQHTRALGMDADSGVERGILLRIGDHLCGRRHRISHADDLCNPRLGGTRNHLRTVFVVALIVEMGVRINVYGAHTSMRGKSCSAVPTACPSGVPPHAASESCTAAKSDVKPSCS